MNEAYPKLIIGIGNQYRGDDAVGPYVADLARSRKDDSLRVMTNVSDGTALISSWEKAELAIVIDCTYSRTQPGTIRRFEIPGDTLPVDLFDGYSTHSISVADVVAIAEALGKLPRQLIVYGIEGSVFRPGSEMSDEVRQAAHAVGQMVREEISDFEIFFPNSRRGDNHA